MNSNKNQRILLTSIFAAISILSGVMLITTASGTSILAPAFAQGENMSGGGNYTEGNMTGSDMTGRGVATPPTTTP